MKTCDECRYYIKSEFMKIGGDCLSPKFRGGYYRYFSNTDSKDYNSVPIDGVIVENDEGWKFHVGAKFGCIHFIEVK